MNLRHIFILFGMLGFISCAGVKQKRLAKNFQKKQSDTMQTPYWTTMMDDTNTLFANTVSAFDLFWKNKKKPVEDEINEGEDIFENKNDSDTSKGNLDYVYQYKRFLAWKQKNQYSVKENGKIMTEYDILQQWKKSKLQDTAN